MNTLKQKRFLKELPKNGYNMAASMRKAGYSEASARSGEQYGTLRRLTRSLDFFDPEKIKRDIKQTRKMAKDKRDVTNLNRIDEHRSKIAGMIVDKAQVDNKHPDKIVIVYDKEKRFTPEPQDRGEDSAKQES